MGFHERNTRMRSARRAGTRPDRIEAFIEELPAPLSRAARHVGITPQGDGRPDRPPAAADRGGHGRAGHRAWFEALGARLATEEAKLAQFEAERAALTDQRPMVMPHPALIARYVEDLLTTLDTDIPKARAMPLHPHARRRQLQNLRGSTFRLSWAPESLKNPVAGACYRIFQRPPGSPSRPRSCGRPREPSAVLSYHLTHLSPGTLGKLRRSPW